MAHSLDNLAKHRELILVTGGLMNAGSRTTARGRELAQLLPPDGFAVNGTELAHFGDSFFPPLGESEVNVEIRGTPAITVDVGLEGGELEIASLRIALRDMREGMIPTLEPFVRT